MQPVRKTTSKPKRLNLSKVSDVDLSMEVRKRFQPASAGILPEHISQRAVTLQEWQNAVDLAKNRHTLSRWQLYRVYDSVALDLHLDSAIEDRILKIQATKFRLIDPSGNEDTAANQMLEAQWYSDYLKYAIESIFYGYSLIELFNFRSEPTTIKLDSGTKSFMALAESTLIERSHVRPEEGKWLVNSFEPIGSGISYTEAPTSNYYIGVGKPKDLGKLMKIAPVALAKRYAQAAWSEYDEKMGIPFRWVTMQGTNNKREKMLGDIMRNMGSAGWAVLQEGEKIELLQNAQGDPYKCFEALLQYLDKSMSKAVLGETMTKDDGSSRSQGEVHLEISELRHYADKVFITYLNNSELLPRLAKMGYPCAGYKYEVDNKEQLSLKDSITIDTVLLQHYKIAPEYIADKYGIPIEMIEGKTDKQVSDVLNEAAKKKSKPSMIANGLRLSMSARVAASYASCCGDHVTMKADFPEFEGLEAILSAIYDGTLKPEDLDPNLYQFTYDELMKAVEKGFSVDLSTIDYNSPDGAMIAQIRDNVHVFSGFKTYQELREMTDMLLDADGNLKTKAKFKKDVLAVHKDYDKRFLSAEYDNVVVSSQSASQWLEWDGDESVVNLIYDATLDGRTTELCSSLDGTIKPKTDPFWSRYMTPNHWGERSAVYPVNDKATDTTPAPEVKEMFANNVGKTGVVFPESHPYFETSKTAKAKINEALKGLKK